MNQVFGFDRLGVERTWLMTRCRLLNPDTPGQSDMLMSFTDVTNERAAADKVMFYASHDALTKLPNRASVLRKIDRALATPDHHRRLRAVLFIDIDDLKTVNDTLGYTGRIRHAEGRGPDDDRDPRQHRRGRGRPQRATERRRHPSGR